MPLPCHPAPRPSKQFEGSGSAYSKGNGFLLRQFKLVHDLGALAIVNEKRGPILQPILGRQYQRQFITDRVDDGINFFSNFNELLR